MSNLKKEFEEKWNKRISDGGFRRESGIEDDSDFYIFSWIESKVKESRQQVINDFLNGERCLNCGEEMKHNPLSSCCARCLEEM